MPDSTLGCCSSMKNNDEPSPDKTQSLSYLAYEMRKQKGLLDGDNSRVPILFGDEWSL